MRLVLSTSLIMLLVILTACSQSTAERSTTAPTPIDTTVIVVPTRLTPSPAALASSSSAVPTHATLSPPAPSPTAKPTPPPLFPAQLGSFSFEAAPTPDQPLVTALQQLGPATIMYTTPNRELVLIDAATLQKVWITAPATGSPCGMNNDGSTQHGVWSPDGQRIAIECQGANDAVTIVSVLDLQTGRFQRLSANANAEQRWISEHIGAWSSDSAYLVLQSIAQGSDTNVIAFAILDVQTGEATPLPAMAAASPPIWSADGTQLAFLGRSTAEAPMQLYLMTWQHGKLGQPHAITLSPSSDAFLRLSSWGDNNTLFGVRISAEGQEYPIRIDTLSGIIQELTQQPASLIWAPNRQHYLLQEKPANVPPLP